MDFIFAEDMSEVIAAALEPAPSTSPGTGTQVIATTTETATEQAHTH